MSMNRYVIVQEPACTWAVFDTLSDAPADSEDQIASGLDKFRAIEMASRANATIRDEDGLVTILRAALKAPRSARQRNISYG